MAGKKEGGLSPGLVRARDRFRAWRRRRNLGTRIPEPLWTFAVKLARDEGICRTASVLGLDYYSLKKRVDRADGPASSSTFVELPSSPLISNECVIEWEDAAGARMRVHVKGQNLPDVLALSRSFWNAD